MTDPLEELPSELIVPALSSLSTPQRSLLTGVCRGWRIALHSDPILNRVTDLKNVNKPLEEMQMIKVVQRLCQLSTHPRNELLLDITNFWYSFAAFAAERSVHGARMLYSRPNGLSSLLSAIVLGTRGELDKLLIQVDEHRGCRLSMWFEDAFLKDLILFWDELLAMMKEVRELHLQIPTSPITLQARGPGEGGKVFVIQGGLAHRTGTAAPEWTTGECKEILERVVAFTGAKVTHLGISTSSFESVKKLYKVLHQHKDSLNHLKLKVEGSDRPELALQLAVHCENLSSFELFYWYVPEELTQMMFPSDAPISRLKKFKFSTRGPRIDFSSYSFLKWLGKELEFLELESSEKIPLHNLELIFRSNPLLKVIKLNEVETFKPSDSFISSPLMFINLRHFELDSIIGYGLAMFSKVSVPALEDLSVTTFEEEFPYAQLFSILQSCHLSLKSFKMRHYEEYPSSSSSDSDPKQDLLKFPLLEELSIVLSPERMSSLYSRCQFASSRLKRLEISSLGSVETNSVLQAIRFVEDSSMTIEVVSLLLSHDHLTSELELDQTKHGRAFPNMRSLHLDWGSQQLMDYFSSSSFGKLENLELAYYEEEPDEPDEAYQAYQKQWWKRAISIVQSSSDSLREIKISGFAEGREDELDVGNFTLHKLKVLSLVRSFPILNQYLLDHSRGAFLSELQLNALPESYSLDDLLRVILPMSRSLTRLSLTDINFRQDQIDSSLEKESGSSFPLLHSLSIRGDNLNLLKLFAQYRFPLLCELFVSAELGETEAKISQIKNLLWKNAPQLSTRDLKSDFHFCKIIERVS